MLEVRPDILVDFLAKHCDPLENLDDREICNHAIYKEICKAEKRKSSWTAIRYHVDEIWRKATNGLRDLVRNKLRSNPRRENRPGAENLAIHCVQVPSSSPSSVRDVVANQESCGRTNFPPPSHHGARLHDSRVSDFDVSDNRSNDNPASNAAPENLNLKSHETIKHDNKELDHLSPSSRDDSRSEKSCIDARDHLAPRNIIGNEGLTALRVTEVVVDPVNSNTDARDDDLHLSEDSTLNLESMTQIERDEDIDQQKKSFEVTDPVKERHDQGLPRSDQEPVSFENLIIHNKGAEQGLTSESDRCAVVQPSHAVTPILAGSQAKNEELENDHHIAKEVEENSFEIETCSAFNGDAIRRDQSSSDSEMSHASSSTIGSNKSEYEISVKSNCSRESNDNYSLSNSSNEDDQYVDHLKKKSCFSVEVGNVSIRIKNEAFTLFQDPQDRPKYRALGAYILKKYLGKTCPLRNYGDFRHTKSGTVFYAMCRYQSHRQRFLFVVLQEDVSVFRTFVYGTKCESDEHLGRRIFVTLKGQERLETAKLLECVPAQRFRREVMDTIDDDLAALGDMQNLRSLSTYKNLKTETNAKVSIPLKVLLYSKRAFRLWKLKHWILYVDATGSLFKVPKDIFNRMYMYAMSINIDGVILPQIMMLSEQHHKNAIGEMADALEDLANEENKKHPRFKIAVSDWCWAIMKALMERFNLVTPSQYLMYAHMFVLERVEIPENFVIIYSCVGHFMHRVSDNLKKKFSTCSKEHKSLVLDAMGVMVRCRTIKQMDTVYKSFMEILCSEFAEEVPIKLQKILETKLEIEESLKAKSKKNKRNPEEIPSEDGRESTQEGESSDEDEDWEMENDQQHMSIYSSSPFYQRYSAKLSEIRMKSEKGKIINGYQNTKLAYFVTVNYMPYCPMWSAFFLALLPRKYDRLANANSEAFNKNVKHQVLLRQKAGSVGRFSEKMRIYQGQLCKEIELKLGKRAGQDGLDEKLVGSTSRKRKSQTESQSKNTRPRKKRKMMSTSRENSPSNPLAEETWMDKSSGRKKRKNHFECTRLIKSIEKGKAKILKQSQEDKREKYIKRKRKQDSEFSSDGSSRDDQLEEPQKKKGKKKSQRRTKQRTVSPSESSDHSDELKRSRKTKPNRRTKQRNIPRLESSSDNSGPELTPNRNVDTRKNDDSLNENDIGMSYQTIDSTNASPEKTMRDENSIVLTRGISSSALHMALDKFQITSEESFSVSLRPQGSSTPKKIGTGCNSSSLSMTIGEHLNNGLVANVEYYVERDLGPHMTERKFTVGEFELIENHPFSESRSNQLFSNEFATLFKGDKYVGGDVIDAFSAIKERSWKNA
ncbi:hypothetical protein QAD02_007805 [Eretmocerus hayati]|uniref:Uncharacterized protein n=1 Tax=Eretmocerus hayati TaxID=131215 RepID=A0ACC2N4Q2_9HYME|nr:hypothetical protein QAD02_007805 [Eretmocerus hayati]